MEQILITPDKQIYNSLLFVSYKIHQAYQKPLYRIAIFGLQLMYGFEIIID